MVSFEKCTDVLLRSLIGFIHLYASVHQLKRIKHKSNSIQDTSFPCLLLNKFIKLLFVWAWNYIPQFCLTCMAIINRIQPWVFNMPAKWGKHHSHIDPWYRHTTNKLMLLVSYFQNRRRWFVHVVDVEQILFIVKVFIFWIFSGI